jgi:hypothetical protein
MLNARTFEATITNVYNASAREQPREVARQRSVLEKLAAHLYAIDKLQDLIKARGSLGGGITNFSVEDIDSINLADDLVDSPKNKENSQQAKHSTSPSSPSHKPSKKRHSIPE